MASPSVIDVAVNPNNDAQRYIYWNTGRIDAVGGAVPVTNQQTWYDRFEPPGVAIHVTDWATGSGYTLDYRGGFEPFGDAPDIGVIDSNDPLKAGVPQVQGVPVTASPRVRRYVDWSWNPDGSGQGYVMDLWGEYLAFGGAAAPARTGRKFAYPYARKFDMRWTPNIKAVMVTMNAGVHGDWGASAGAVSGSIGRPTQDVVRDIAVTDWTNPVQGLLLDQIGALHQFGGRSRPAGWRFRRANVARTLKVLSVSNPERYWIVWSGGEQFEFVSSTPPAVVAGGSDPVSPAATVTDTTRPDLLWAYSDAQSDEQAGWQVLVYTQAFANSHSMTDPLAWVGDALVAREGIDRTARGIECPVHLPNGNYRLFVRVKDTAEQWSAWDSHDWTQNVPLPATPTGLSATANQSTYRVALSVSATTGGSADSIRFDFSDDGGTTWSPVRGADAVPIASTTTATDYDAPLGVTRLYRAVAFNDDPAVASVSSVTDSALLTGNAYLLTAVADPTLGGEVSAQEPSEWTRTNGGGVFWGLGSEFPTVVTDGTTKARRTDLHVISESRAEWDRLEALVESGSVLVYRDPFGEVVYCRSVGDWRRALAPGVADRHIHYSTLPLVEVRPPQDA